MRCDSVDDLSTLIEIGFDVSVCMWRVKYFENCESVCCVRGIVEIWHETIGW